MTEDFAIKAFYEAQGEVTQKEFDAFCDRLCGENGDNAQMTAAFRVGMDRIESLLKVVFEGKKEETLADYCHNLMLVGFHLGYQAGYYDGLK